MSCNNNDENKTIVDAKEQEATQRPSAGESCEKCAAMLQGVPRHRRFFNGILTPYRCTARQLNWPLRMRNIDALPSSAKELLME